MAYFDNKTNTIVRVEPYECEQYPKWDVLDCGCCGGLEWGGEKPRECRWCGGGGVIFRHRQSGALALYPGGPFIGHEAPQPVVAAGENYDCPIHGLQDGPDCPRC